MKNNIFVILLITILMAVTLLIGCGGNDETLAQEQSKPAASQEIETAAADENSSEDAEVNESEQTTEATKAVESKSSISSKKSAEKTSDKNTTSSKKVTESTKQATKATEAAKVCTITIEGFCDSKSVEIKSGDSVYDILKKSGANVSARNTGYGLYVEGINGRFEFDEGPTSGWVYTVNGSRPSMSCDKYEVKSGDKIVWTYVEEV